jgi:hypothetical protein
MATKNRNNPELNRIVLLMEGIRSAAPQLYAWLNDTADFREVRIYIRDDGEMLGVAKGYNGDGAPVICFGSGFDVFSCLLGLNGAITADRWREDRPAS